MERDREGERERWREKEFIKIFDFYLYRLWNFHPSFQISIQFMGGGGSEKM